MMLMRALLVIGIAGAIGYGCASDKIRETEPNDSIETADGPYSETVELRGEISYGNDDFFAIDLLSDGPISIETDSRLDGEFCNSSHATVRLLAGDGGSIAIAPAGARCPEITPEETPVVGNLPAGRYYVQVSWSALTLFDAEWDAGYDLTITLPETGTE